VEFTILIFAAMVALVIYVFFRGQLGGGRMRCNRCDGTGQVNERWPDPQEPGGWHIVEGTCPKCKGRGYISGR
jgi:DnaJ-class molecular chaperone